MDIEHDKGPEITDKMLNHWTLTPGRQENDATLLQRHRNQTLEVFID